MSHFFAPKLVTTGQMTLIDDGTYVTAKLNTTSLFRIIKSTGQMEIVGGYSSDITF